jgi:hypothetical protein
MLATKPLWTYRSEKGLTQWYGHVHLLQDKAAGQWFAVDRSTGNCLWEKSFRRPNNIWEITGNIILANETRSDGPWTLNFGCYALSLVTGELIWQWHGPGPWGWLVRHLDLVPEFTNEFRPTFLGTKGSECLVTPNRVLDVQTGKLLRREPDPSKLKKEYKPRTKAEKLYAKQPVMLTQELELSYESTVVETPGQINEVRMELILRDADKSEKWRWGPHLLGLKCLGSFYGWRLLDDTILFLGSEDRQEVPDTLHPDKNYVVRNPTRYHLVQLNAITGAVMQRFPLNEEKVAECRLEDVDTDGVLISYERKDLSYFPFAKNETPA